MEELTEIDRLKRTLVRRQLDDLFEAFLLCPLHLSPSLDKVHSGSFAIYTALFTLFILPFLGRLSDLFEDFGPQFRLLLHMLEHIPHLTLEFGVLLEHFLELSGRVLLVAVLLHRWLLAVLNACLRVIIASLPLASPGPELGDSLVL